MRYNVAVLGGGPAGYSAALTAASLGMKTVLFEDDLIGGTCLNRGCVPTKFLIHAAELLSQINSASRYGITAQGTVIDFVKTKQESRNIVLQLREGLSQLMVQKKIDVIPARAEISDRTHVIAMGTVYEADNILIATGSASMSPLVEGALSSDELLELDHIPDTLEILGGGVVATEFAWLFSLLGTRVTIKIRADRILRKWDRELATAISQRLKKNGVTILTKCTPEIMSKSEAELVLSAAGRKPVLPAGGEGLYDLGADNGIIVNEACQTKTAGLYAAGDVTSNSVQLAHIAMEQGKRAVLHMADKPAGKAGAVISCIYLTPEAASVGMTEAQAKDSGISTVSAKQVMGTNARTLISSQERGFIKLVAAAGTGRILGAQLLCERASDIAAEIALAIDHALTAQDLLATTRPHPSFCEAVTDAAAALAGKL